MAVVNRVMAAVALRNRGKLDRMKHSPGAIIKYLIIDNLKKERAIGSRSKAIFYATRLFHGTAMRNADSALFAL